jgi:hypothetical protein
MSTSAVYQIAVRGKISKRYAAAFEGMEMETKSGQTILTGRLLTTLTSTASSTA